MIKVPPLLYFPGLFGYLRIAARIATCAIAATARTVLRAVFARTVLRAVFARTVLRACRGICIPAPDQRHIKE